MKNILLFWICTFCWSCTVYGGPVTVYTDCEHPPSIHHSKSELSVDDDGIVVTALYTCDAGYQLHGQAQITCNTDTDEWQSDLPVCKLGNGENSPVSEIEAPEVIDSVITISPDITHEEIEIAAPIENPSTDYPNEIQVDPNQSQPDSVTILSEPEETDLVESEDRPSAPVTGQKKRRRKGKNDFQEDDRIDEDFASHLDMSCMDGTTAPSVDDAFIVEYIRARKGDYKFLVAVYDCVESYILENPQSNRLYCSQGSWVGTHPMCIPNGDLDYGNETDDDDGEDDQNENDDVNKSDANNSTPSSQQPNNESEITGEPKVKTIETIPVGLTDENQDTNINEIIPTNENVDPTLENRNDISPSCDVNNGGCEQTCSMVSDEETGNSLAECSCRIGFYLDDEGLKCLDFNECEDPNVLQLCPNGCENTIGSYRCVESPDVEIIESNVDVSQATEPNAPVKACGDGLRLDESNNCIDIDECAEGNTGCEYCQNINGGFQCTCPDGFELNDDGKTCKDINECTTFSEYEYEDNTPTTVRSVCSHECINTIGSFTCRCPLNLHLRDDQRTCEQDLCRHLGDIASNKTKCTHDCVDEADGYHCKCPDGMDLAADLKTCISQDICGTEGDRCLPGKCVSTNDGSFECECPTGFAAHNRRCIDYDECAISTHQCSHQCKNIDGSYLCECPDDLILASDGHTCISSDLCAIDNGGCSDTCNIVNEKVVCSCSEGTELNADGKMCDRKNICSSNNGGCNQICNVELNRCECYPGFQTFDDGKTCQDLNECLQNNGGCRQQCINKEGSFECTCFEGFESDEESGECFDRNECDLNNGNCDHTCVNTEGSYLCSCRPGFHLSNDQHQCFDINECDSNNGNCSHTCVNLQGSYQCSCPEGQFLVNDELTCGWLNVCEVNNGGCSHTCSHDRGVRTCSCPVGFELDEAGTVCIDQNECLTNNGGCAHQCENLNGTHVCKCNAGYQLATDKYACLDVDECIESNGNCSNICINLLGSYSCACEAGFELKEDKHTCQDIDECADAIHDCEQICKNVEGSYECGCQPGFKLSRNHLTCIDIDECTIPTACGNASKCINTIGSFQCDCPNGYELSASNECIDKNECDDVAAKRCSHECVNTLGSFKCACPTGMELASDLITCIDINECIVNSGICSHFCDNVEGSFRCSCPVGYQLDANQTTCKDINECQVNNGGCEQKCVNIEGGSYCECDVDGFKLADDKHTCISSDPCGLKNGGCAHVCEPLNGKAQCFCYKGFELNITDNRSCSDINECLLNHGCESKCINTVGSYKCDCPKGFRLNAAGSCEDVNECEVYDNGGCSANSECINFLGSFRCICPTGFKLDHDKVTCIEIKDKCSALAAPPNGDVHCTRSRHPSQIFYQIKCSFWCNEGFTLIGTPVKYCNGTDGFWDSTETVCIPSTCPPLPQPEIGSLRSECLKGKIYPGESCAIICPPRYKKVGQAVAHCLPSRQWSTTNLNCGPAAVKVTLPPKTRAQGGETYSRGQIDLETSAASRKSLLKPYIKCPRDTTILLPNNKKAVHIKLEQPKTNVDWASHVEAHPPWAKRLQAHLAAGVHTITFRARSPNSVSISDECRTVIVVKSANAPQVLFCPSTIQVTLGPNELQRSITWTEPTFRPHQQLRQIFKSHLPGTTFRAGHHKITYIATDIQNLNATCQFSVVVRPAQAARVVNPFVRPQFGQQYQNALPNHDSYLLCPNQPAMKLDTSFPIQIPIGCIIKNVRKLSQIQPYNPHRRRHAFTPNNNFLRYYSSWNSPEYSRYYS